jgi:flagellar biosynthesis chaperone FliJ
VDRRNKLEALLKSCEVTEKEFHKYRAAVEKVVLVRQADYESVKNRYNALDTRVKSLLIESKAIFSGESTASKNVIAIQSFLKRLSKEMSMLTELIGQKESELQSALNRLSIADQDLVNARIEKQKIDKLIQSIDDFSKIKEAASEDFALDELATIRSRNK